MIGAALKVIRFGAGKEIEELETEPTNPAAVLGKRGGAAPARRLTAEQRAQIARKAAAKPWAKGE